MKTRPPLRAEGVGGEGWRWRVREGGGGGGGGSGGGGPAGFLRVDHSDSSPVISSIVLPGCFAITGLNSL